MLHEADVCQAFKSMSKEIGHAHPNESVHASRPDWKHWLISVVGSPSALALYPKQSSPGMRFLLLDKTKYLLPVSYYSYNKYLTVQ